MILASAALCFSILTTFVLGVFVMHRDTPIVKANNHSLSYILLTSLTLCFLSSLLFIGHPTPAICILRQTTFAIVFTVAIASILAKTITVVLAFRATKPGSKLRRWLGASISYFLTLICTLIQMCICGIWLGTYPPFLEMDTYSEASIIVIQCNEGSLVSFYCVLGYMGFLALVSFTLAFLARNLPDTFNEAKHLTFSVLLHKFLKCVNPVNGIKNELCGDGTLMTAETYDILNFQSLPGYYWTQVKVGELTPHKKELSINEEDIDWPEDFSQIPSSTCSMTCGPGFRKQSLEGQPICCFDCTLCPDGKISNKTNTEQCIQCSEDEYPSEEKDRCLPKTVTFLAYEETLGMILASTAFCFSILTTFVFGVFVIHRDTPIVKANNRSLSYILLTSLTLCFLSSLLFIGHPTPAICLLRQTTFAIVFTVAIASILAKTITVVLAFRATKPGSKLRRWLGASVSYFLIFICTLIQMCLCGIWLGTYPPFLEMDPHSEVSIIVIQCNEGSLVSFYCVLGYMGFLALVSFTLAFLARNLPDTFNEAKYLTFSMLVFCSVWISFLPTYQSTKGKAMVAMEIFSILVSSAGILTCIFVPKCYVILLRTDRNTLEIWKNKANT
ncbi:vomeronasal type-2 receptor 26-like [Gracilinanus agilis]|uniref:vomeronasal type-2 receptor 26-like n=1 Tax=Gracilinanus agilis TaxID=191870 RepID=UPI001CFE4C6A|nr:vomeronasal type-2 receptor 26-like [Gracilinanus agilis]